MTDDAARTAERLVRERFPTARAAWLEGSAASRSMTTTSDLDITVLMPSTVAAFRESLLVSGQSVEFFVHTEESLRIFCARDRDRRRPTLLRLVGSSVVLIDTDGSGRRLREQLHRLDREGPSPLTPDEMEGARYAVTDLLDDLADGGPEAMSVAAALWQETAELILGAGGRWCGTGKWLLRELEAFDADRGTGHAASLLGGLAAVGRGDITPMQEAVTAALAPLGGRFFEGYRREGPPGVEIRRAHRD